MSSQTFSIKKLAGIILLVIFAWLIWDNSASLKVQTIPYDAKISYKGKIYTPGQSIKDHPSNFEVMVARVGYPSRSTTIHVGFLESKSVKVDLALSDTIPTANGRFTSLTPQQSAARKKFDQSLDQINQTNIQKYPFISKLPYIDSSFRIDYGASKKSGAAPDAVAFYIKASDNTAKQSALDWLTSQGANLSELEIIYQ